MPWGKLKDESTGEFRDMTPDELREKYGTIDPPKPRPWNKGRKGGGKKKAGEPAAAAGEPARPSFAGEQVIGALSVLPLVGVTILARRFAGLDLAPFYDQDSILMMRTAGIEYARTLLKDVALTPGQAYAAACVNAVAGATIAALDAQGKRPSSSSPASSANGSSAPPKAPPEPVKEGTVVDPDAPLPEKDVTAREPGGPGGRSATIDESRLS